MVKAGKISTIPAAAAAGAAEGLAETLAIA